MKIENTKLNKTETRVAKPASDPFPTHIHGWIKRKKVKVGKKVGKEHKANSIQMYSLRVN